jgi:hypothetical protein
MASEPGDFDGDTEFDELLRAQAEFMSSGKPPAAKLTSKPKPKLSAKEQRELLYSRVNAEQGQVWRALAVVCMCGFC